MKQLTPVNVNIVFSLFRNHRTQCIITETLLYKHITLIAKTIIHRKDVSSKCSNIVEPYRYSNI